MGKVGASKGRHVVTSESLSQKWLISPELTRITVQHKIQRGIRKILHPSLLRRFKTNYRELMYNRLQHSVFTNKIQAGTVSRSGNWYAQVYSSRFAWARAHPMKRKGDALVSR